MELLSIEPRSINKFLNTFIATYRNKNNKLKEYEVISRDKTLDLDGLGTVHNDAVGIIAFNTDMTKILVQREFRLACNNWVINFPGGLIDKGENAEVAAKRELWEETGLEVTDILTKLPAAYTAVGISDETSATIICKATGEFKPSTSFDEEIEPMWITKEQALELVKHEKMSLRTQSVLLLWGSSLDN